MEIVAFIILCWGVVGVLSLGFIGLREERKAYKRRRKEMRAMEFTGPKKRKKKSYLNCPDCKKELVRLKELEAWKWPYQRRSGEHYEYACPHGVGHSVNGIHGCDGCCGHPSFKKEMRNIKRLFRKGGGHVRKHK